MIPRHDEPLFLTPAQAAGRIGGGMKESTLRRKAQAKTWPSHKLGARLVFTEGDLEQIVALTAVQPVNPFQTTRQKRRAS